MHSTRSLEAPLAIAILLSMPQGGLGREPAAPHYADHSRLMVYLDRDGHEHPVNTPEDWAVRRAHVLAGMQQAMGPLPDRTNLPPLDVRVTERVEEDRFVRLSLSFVAEPGDRVPAYLYLPKGLAPGERVAAMLALHPTSTLGKGVVAGLGPRPNRAYALELARRGYVVLAPDYPSFGDYPYDFAKDKYVSGTMKGIFNHMRCVDLLQARAEVSTCRAP